MAKALQKNNIITYDWKGLSHNGAPERGEIDAKNLKDARRLVKNKGIKIKRIRRQAKFLLHLLA